MPYKSWKDKSDSSWNQSRIGVKLRGCRLSLVVVIVVIIIVIIFSSFDHCRRRPVFILVILVNELNNTFLSCCACCCCCSRPGCGRLTSELWRQSPIETGWRQILKSKQIFKNKPVQISRSLIYLGFQDEIVHILGSNVVIVRQLKLRECVAHSVIACTSSALWGWACKADAHSLGVDSGFNELLRLEF